MSNVISQTDAYPITVQQGRTFAEELTYTLDGVTPVNLTGWTARGQIKRYAGDYPVMANFAIAIDAPNGVIRFSLSAIEAMGVNNNGVYEIVLISAGSIVTTLSGPVTYVPRVVLA